MIDVDQAAEVVRIINESGVPFSAYNLIAASIDPVWGIRHGLKEKYPAAAEIIDRDYERVGKGPFIRKRSIN
jgi:hypothetical protein